MRLKLDLKRERAEKMENLNKILVEDLERVINEHKLWLENGANFEKKGRADFKGLDLSEMDLSGQNLERALFDDCDISNCIFRGTFLAGAVFYGCAARFADFRGADLRGAVPALTNFEGANFQDVIFGEPGNYSDDDKNLIDHLREHGGVNLPYLPNEAMSKPEPVKTPDEPVLPTDEDKAAPSFESEQIENLLTYSFSLEGTPVSILFDSKCRISIVGAEGVDARRFLKKLESLMDFSETELFCEQE